MSISSNAKIEIPYKNVLSRCQSLEEQIVELLLSFEEHINSLFIDEDKFLFVSVTQNNASQLTERGITTVSSEELKKSV